jgi:hypothetical protein
VVTLPVGSVAAPVVVLEMRVVAEDATDEATDETAPAVQLDWQPVPQWSGVLPHQPYWEQHPPCGQLPQTVPPLAAPQLPSVVTFAVAEAAGADEAGELAGTDEALELAGADEARPEEAAEHPD